MHGNFFLVQFPNSWLMENRVSQVLIVVVQESRAVLSYGEPRDAAVNFDTYRNPVDVNASGTKASTKHLESRLYFRGHSKGHTFWDE